MNPAMVAVAVLGLTLIWFDAVQQRWGWAFLMTPWMLVKLAGALFLIWWHHYLGRARVALAAGRRDRTARFWRMTNELPFVVMIVADPRRHHQVFAFSIHAPRVFSVCLDRPSGLWFR